MTRLGFVTAMVAAALSGSAALASDLGAACGALSSVSAPGGGEGIDLRAIDADGSDVWTVGRRIDPAGDAAGSPLAMRWDGATFVAEPLPDLSHLGSQPTLESVALATGGEPWVVGGLVDSIDGSNQPLILRWSAGFWQTYPITYVSSFVARYPRLTDVATAGVDDAWTVGRAGSVSGTVEPFAAQWNGSAWAETAFPGTTANRYLTAVSAVRDTVFAVGYDAVGAGARGTTFARVYIFKGGEWSVMETPADTKVGSVLSDVVVLSVNDVWAVGTVEATGLFLHWDGATWSTVEAPVKADPRSVSAVVSDDVWAAGSQGLYRWNGKSWTFLSAPDAGIGARRMVAVASSCDVWSVAVKQAGTGVKSDIERFSTTTPAPEPPPAPFGLTATPKGPKQIVLGWLPGKSDPTGSIAQSHFVIERCVGDETDCAAPYAVIQKVSGKTTEYVDLDVAPATTYAYRVYAVNDAGASKPTAPVAALSLPDDTSGETVPVPVLVIATSGPVAPLTPQAEAVEPSPVSDPVAGVGVIINAPLPEPPAMPVGLVAKGESSKTINLYWQSGDSTSPVGQDWFIIERCVVEDGSCVARFVILAKAAVTSYVDSAVRPGTAYAYRITAVNAAGKSDATSPETASTLPADPSSPGTTTGRTRSKS